NSGILVEQYGHFTIEQLQWLKNDLKNIGSDKPIIMAAHHPLMGDRRYVDNEIDLMRIIADYNVVLYLCGHGHRNKHRKINGIDFLMTEAVKSESPGYRIISMDSRGKITVSNREVFPKTTIREFTRSSTKIINSANYSFRAPSKTKIYEDNLPVLMSGNKFSQPEVSINNHEWAALNRGGRKYFQNLDISDLSEGKHTMLFRYQVNDETWLDFFDVNIDRRKTKIVFKTNIGSEIHGKAAIVNDALVFGAYDGKVYAVSADSGKILWTFQTGAEVVTEPAANSDTLFITSGDGYCYALNAKSGLEYWRKQVAKAIFSSPTYADGKVFFGAADSCVYSLRSSDGSVIWIYKTDGHVKAQPAVKYNKVLVGAWDGYFYCLSTLNGELKWRKQISDNIYYSAATSNPLIEIDNVFFASHEHTVFSYDIDTGNLQWQHLVSDNHKPGYSSPLEFDDKIVLGSISGHLFALDDDNGDEIWTTALADSLDSIFDSSPVLNYPSVVTGSINGMIYSVYIDTGVMNWTHKLSEKYIFATTVAKRGTVYVGSYDGNFYAITEAE
ncbi:PQQ-binding-like beta-propeller repeat protein, partial [candidate division KSB1 bacterium]|nr:PQQ-binding-like beta-propeller repeat protein [candidate division KSB1 bacterium]